MLKNILITAAIAAAVMFLVFRLPPVRKVVVGDLARAA